MVSQKGYPVKQFPLVSAAQAFGDEHLNDLHFTCYNAFSKEGVRSGTSPRLTKGVLALIERISEGPLAGAQVLGTSLAVDYDLPNHATWTPELVSSTKDMLDRAAERAPIIAQPSVFYTTAKGMRLVWFLAEPVPVDGPSGLEDLLGGLIVTCVQAGLYVDPSCKDWTRIFRLPRVRREDEKAPGVVVHSRTTDQAYLHQSWGRYDFTANEPIAEQVVMHHASTVRPLSRWQYPELVDSDGRAASPQIGELAQLWKAQIGREPLTVRQRMAKVQLPDQPSNADVAMLYSEDESSSASHVLTHSIKAWITAWAKVKGKNQTPLAAAVYAFEILYNGKSLIKDPAASGQLHAGVLKLANAICSTLREHLGDPVTPDMVYALVLQRARSADKERPEGSRRDPKVLEDEVWSVVGWAYQQQRSQTILEDEHVQQEVLAQETHLRTQLVDESSQIDHIKRALREAIRRSDQTGAPVMPAHYDWVEKHWGKLLIINVQGAGNAALQITPAGKVVYSAVAKSHGALLALTERCGHDLIITEKPATTSGPPVERSEPALLKQYATVTDALRSSRLITHNTIELQERAGELQVGFIKRLPGMRTDIRPCRDSTIHNWLYALGGNHAEKFLDWLAVFHLIEYQCCGLYIQGPPGIGKGMLGKALAYLTEATASAPFYSVMESFQDMMVQTPYVWMDETASTAQRSMKSMMHTYKTLVTGEFDTPNSKGEKVNRIEGQWRVLITSNRDDSLKPDKDMNEDDLKAIAERTLHIEPDSKGCLEILRSVGKARGTEGWIERGIPGHIAWLAQERAPALVAGMTDRLLIMGEDSPWLAAMATKTEGTNILLRTIARILRGSDPTMAMDDACKAAVEAVGDVVLINRDAMKDAMTGLFGGERDTRIPNGTAIELSLKHLSGAKESEGKTRKGPAMGKYPARRRVWEINLGKLMRACYTSGEEIDFRSTITDEVWRRLAPPEVVKEHDDLVALERAEHQATAMRTPPAPPKPEWMNGHTNGHVNGHVNGHHPAPVHVGHTPSSQPFLGAGPPPPPPQPPPLPGLN